MQQTTLLGADVLSVISYQLSLLMEAGIVGEESVALLARDAADKHVRAALEGLHTRLSEGATLSEAMAVVGSFPDYMVRMVEIGQAAGRLDEVLSALADYYRRQSETDSAIRRAILYPAGMAVLVAAVFLVLMTRVLPVFARVFDQLGMSLSPMARSLLHFGEAGKYLAGALVLLLALGALVLLFVSRRTASAHGLERYFLGKGAARKAVERSQFAAAMALMLRSGLQLDEAMERTESLLTDSTLSPALAACRAAMDGGTDFPVAVAQCGLLEQMQCGLLAAGFHAGSGEKAMEELASRTLAEADQRLTRLLSRMEFTLVALLCLAVGLVLLSVMLPLLGVLSAIG